MMPYDTWYNTVCLACSHSPGTQEGSMDRRKNKCFFTTFCSWCVNSLQLTELLSLVATFGRCRLISWCVYFHMPADIPVLGYSYNLNHIWCWKPYFNISHVKELFPPSWHRDMCCCFIQKNIIFPVKYLQFASQSRAQPFTRITDGTRFLQPLHCIIALLALCFAAFLPYFSM